MSTEASKTTAGSMPEGYVPSGRDICWGVWALITQDRWSLLGTLLLLAHWATYTVCGISGFRVMYGALWTCICGAVYIAWVGALVLWDLPWYLYVGLMVCVCGYALKVIWSRWRTFVSKEASFDLQPVHRVRCQAWYVRTKVEFMKAVHVVSETWIPDDPEVLHPCIECRRKAAFLVGPVLTEKLLKPLARYSVPYKEHSCDGLLAAKLVALAAHVHRKEPEGKAKNMQDKKHYVRGGKTVSLKLKGLSDEDYSRIIDALEDGDIEAAEDLVANYYGNSRGDTFEGGSVEDYARYHANIRAATSHIAERAGVNSRSYWEATRSRRPEGKEAYRLAVGEHWPKYTEDALAAWKAECVAEKKVHDAVMLEALAVSSSGTPEALVPPAKRARNRRGRKNKAPESAVIGNNPVVKARYVAAVQFHDGRTMQGLLVKGASSHTWFITGRHKNQGRKVLDGFSGVGVGDAVTVYRPNMPPCQTKIGELRGEGDDRVAVRLHEVAGQVYTCKYRPPAVGRRVTAAYFSKGEWHDTVGSILHVGENHFVYDMSTEAGCCRMAIFDEGGYVVGGHYYPEVDTPKGAHPGGQFETGVLPKGWNPVYNQPPMVPDGKAVLEDLGKVGPFQREEKHKVYPLRSDVDMSGYKPEYFMAKPSTDMLVTELQKFGESSPELDVGLLEQAVKALLLIEETATVRYVEPVLEDFVRVVEELDAERTNAGADSLGDSHRDYLLHAGEGDLVRGYMVAGTLVYDLYLCLCGKREWTDEMRDVALRCGIYTVQGKKDGYKAKKLYVGRSIQAPTFTLKVLWKTVFGPSDSFWGARNWMFRTGADPDLPVPDAMAGRFANALACLGLDETAFDRKMPREFMEAFFNIYLPYVYPGVPGEVCAFMAHTTIHTHLLMTTGRVFVKHQGNPSGFPATLRLNCVVQLLSWCYAVLLRSKQMGEVYAVKDVVGLLAPESQDVFLEICGDDSRLTVLTEKAMAFFGATEGWAPWLAVWNQHLPWAVKIEGQVVFERNDGRYVLPLEDRLAAMPPLVARNIVLVDGYMWTPLWNMDRCVRKVMSVDGDRQAGPLGRTEEQDEVLRRSAFVTLRLALDWHLRGQIYSPLIQCLIDNGWYEEHVGDICQNLVGAAYREAHFRRRKWDSEAQ